MAAARFLASLVGAAAVLLGNPSRSPEAAEPPPTFEPVSLEASNATVRLSVVGSYRGGMFSENTPGGPPVYDLLTRRIYVASADRRAIEGLDVSNPAKPRKVVSIDLNPYGGEANSLALHRGVLAVTVENAEDNTRPGSIVFLNLEGKLLSDPLELGRLSRVAFSPNGHRLVATISGSPNDDYTDDPESGIVVVTLHGVTWWLCRFGSSLCRLHPEVHLLDFRPFNDRRDELVAAGVRIVFPTATVAEDLEPSGMTIITCAHRSKQKD